MPKKEPVSLRHPRPQDRFRDPTGPVQAWRPVPGGAVVVPRSSEEEERRGPIVIAGFMIVVPSSVEVPENNEVLVRGETHQIDGAVGDYGRKKIFYSKRVN